MASHWQQKWSAMGAPTDEKALEYRDKYKRCPPARRYSKKRSLCLSNSSPRRSYTRRGCTNKQRWSKAKKKCYSPKKRSTSPKKPKKKPIRRVVDESSDSEPDSPVAPVKKKKKVSFSLERNKYHDVPRRSMAEKLKAAFNK